MARKDCAGCKWVDEEGICNFYLETGVRRGCPGGKNCTRYETGERRRYNTVGKKASWDTALGRELWQQGKTDAEIAAACGAEKAEWVASFRCNHWEKELPPEELAKRKEGAAAGRKPKWDTELGRQMHLEGRTAREIAEATGATISSVHDFVRRVWKKNRHICGASHEDRPEKGGRPARGGRE